MISLQAYYGAVERAKVALVDNPITIAFTCDRDEEAVAFQKWQAWMFADQMFDLDLANHLYHLLGRENPTADKFNAISPPERVVIALLFDRFRLPIATESGFNR